MLKRIIALACLIGFAHNIIFGQYVNGTQFPAVIAGTGYANLGQNSIEANLFKPELVMKHQRALELTDAQKNAILGAYQQAQSDFTKWQWELQAATENLTEMVSGDQINEQESLKQLEKMLDLERNIKRTQLGLMIKIKNQLTPEQQKKLKELQFPGFNNQSIFNYYNNAAKLNKLNGKSLWKRED